MPGIPVTERPTPAASFCDEKKKADDITVSQTSESASQRNENANNNFGAIEDVDKFLFHPRQTKKRMDNRFVKDYLILAVLVSLGCPPFGLLAVWFALRCRRLAGRGDRARAMRASTITFYLVLASILVMICTIILTSSLLIYATWHDPTLISRLFGYHGNPEEETTWHAVTGAPPSVTAPPLVPTTRMMDGVFNDIFRERYNRKA